MLLAEVRLELMAVKVLQASLELHLIAALVGIPVVALTVALILENTNENKHVEIN